MMMKRLMKWLMMKGEALEGELLMRGLLVHGRMEGLGEGLRSVLMIGFVNYWLMRRKEVLVKKGFLEGVEIQKIGESEEEKKFGKAW
mmetsp:Transcript_3173/g.4870  ORF Transcript_3173/g.4870 Transcript_3173/m.4870 type:complete len:87 (+) Transcript_3173:402-662(+)